MTLITPSTHLPPSQDYWMVEYEGHWMLQDNLNKVLKQHITYHVVKFNPNTHYPGPAEAKLNWIGRYVTACVRTQGAFGGMPLKENFQIWCSEIASEAIFWTLLQPYLQLLAGFDNAMISLLRNHVATCTSIVYQARPSLTFQKSERRSSRCY